MLKAVAIAPDIYWVGVIDWNERYFHGYTTERGSTYNAYIILDEKITLIDTAKLGMSDELIARISDVIDPAKIDYVISNHVEMDHSGSIPEVLALAPNATLITGEPKGLEGLRAHYGDDLPYKTVKTGDTLTIGKRTLSFLQTPMVHWPDNMVTYSEYDKILFSNDAFGQHFASSKRFDDEVELDEVLLQAKKYYANIVMPYSPMVKRALAAASKLDIAMIAPAHGIIWRSHIDEILSRYTRWANQELEETALVIYDSMWHSTEKMAYAILEAFIESGIPARLYDLKVNHDSDIMTEVLTARYLAVGSPTLNMTYMPTMAEFLCFLRGLTPKKSGRVGIAFGSYGWASAGPDGIASVMTDLGIEMPLGTITHQWPPKPEDLDAIHQSVSSYLLSKATS